MKSRGVAALMSGAVCLAILGGMIVVHAWPLWTGTSVLLPVVPIDPRDMFRGDYVRLSTPAERLTTRAGATTSVDRLAVTPVGGDWAKRSVPPPAVYVQLEPTHANGEWRPVSVSLDPVAGAVNLRGRVRFDDTSSESLNVDYGLDRYYVQEGNGRAIEDAIRSKRRVEMEVAVAASGHARIRRLLIDGIPAGQ
ncbi:MAG TPA: GDYXXLXY domain-containing protein [Vicinamibacterales bacterium]|nr:GDYXXLXY domain-containing protein [Vicinamibacterales bacterium]